MPTRGVDAGYEASLHARAFFENGGERIWISRVGSGTEVPRSRPYAEVGVMPDW
jgi:hypothetical protein